MLNTINPISGAEFRRWRWVVVLSLFFTVLKAQPPLFKVPAYVSAYAEEAVDQMIEHSIPASVILAQAIFESSSGTSELAKRSNNHFGIKCHSGWAGDTILKHDDALNECFRRYNSVHDSYTDHSLFLKSRARYAKLFDIPLHDYRAWCRGLKASGYATFSAYAEELIKIIELYRLDELDRAETLPRKLVSFRKDPEIKTSRLNCAMYPPKKIFSKDALFMDEKDVLPHSMELMMNWEDEELAGNKP